MRITWRYSTSLAATGIAALGLGLAPTGGVDTTCTNPSSGTTICSRPGGSTSISTSPTQTGPYLPYNCVYDYAMCSYGIPGITINVGGGGGGGGRPSRPSQP